MLGTGVHVDAPIAAERRSLVDLYLMSILVGRLNILTIIIWLGVLRAL